MFKHSEYQYLDLMKDIMKNGVRKVDRGTTDASYTVFGRQMRFDLSQGFPLLTTKKVYWKGVLHELYWFLSGQSNIKYLVDNNVHIWDDYPFRKYKILNVKSQMLNANGQSLLEVTVAVAIGTLVVAALTFATIFSLRNANFAKNSAQATKLAQEGIERVRSSRDRNQCIEGLTNVNSWNGSTDCSAVSGSGSIWTYPISGDCDKPDLPQAGFCYFKVNSTTGQLTNIGFSFTPTSSVPLPAQAEGIPTTNPVFKRVILLSDDLNHDKNFTNDDYQNQKEVTVIVTWNDFAGTHESRLTTILRKL